MPTATLPQIYFIWRCHLRNNNNHFINLASSYPWHDAVAMMMAPTSSHPRSYLFVIQMHIIFQSFLLFTVPVPNSQEAGASVQQGGNFKYALPHLLVPCEGSELYLPFKDGKGWMNSGNCGIGLGYLVI